MAGARLNLLVHSSNIILINIRLAAIIVEILYVHLVSTPSSTRGFQDFGVEGPIIKGVTFNKGAQIFSINPAAFPKILIFRIPI